MNRQLIVAIGGAASLAAAGIASAWWLVQSRDPPPPPPAAIVDSCKRAAELLFDVSWAAACLQTPDDSADCMLPDAQAAKVNAILAAEEARCLASYTRP